MPSKRLANQLLEAPKHRYCGCISIDIRYRAEAREIDERNGRYRGLEAVDTADFAGMADCGGIDCTGSILLKNSVIEMGFGVGSFSSSVGERLFGGV